MGGPRRRVPAVGWLGGSPPANHRPLATPLPDNRARFTAGEIAAATAGRLIGVRADLVLVGVGTDSRCLVPGSLFVALTGASHDGHRFAAGAGDRGALPLVAAGRRSTGPRIEVDDTLIALGRLAHAFVARETAGRTVPKLAVGGAAGKTTTKTLAAAVARALFGEILVTAGNLNNRIGVPLTLLSLEPVHRAIVVEFGTSEPGEIEALGRIVEPEVGLVLNVGIEHSQNLGGLETIADEEGALLVAATRVAVTSADEPLLLDRLSRSRAARRTFGWSDDADLRILSRATSPGGGARLRLRFAAALASEPLEREVAVRLLGPAVAANVAAAFAGALALLGRPATGEEIDRAIVAVGGVEAPPGRLRPVRGARGELLIDDTYNSNPRSAAAALAAARETADERGASLAVVLGDMLELGDLAEPAHDALLEAADRVAPRQLILIGPELTAAASRRAPRAAWIAYADSDAAAAASPGLVNADEVVLVKGSRGIRTERLVLRLASSDEPLPPL